MASDYSMFSDELLGLATPRGGEHGDDNRLSATAGPVSTSTGVNHIDNSNAMEDDSLQVRTMEVPRWLSTSDVTAHLVGRGQKKTLETEYESTIIIAGHGSGTKDPSMPGFHLPHLHITMTGHDVRQLGRLRRALEDKLIDYVIENTPEQDDIRNAPPSLGRLLYSLALSAANASPKTKDHTPNRTVLARSHYPMIYHMRRIVEEGQNGPPTKKVWMNVVELPQDDNNSEYHGRFLAGKQGSLLEYYRTKFGCRVDIYGVWGDDDDLMCAPYVLVTSENSKSNVDRCLQFIEHRVREHEEKFGASRPGGRRILRGEQMSDS